MSLDDGTIRANYRDENGVQHDIPGEFWRGDDERVIIALLNGDAYLDVESNDRLVSCRLLRLPIPELNKAWPELISRSFRESKGAETKEQGFDSAAADLAEIAPLLRGDARPPGEAVLRSACRLCLEGIVSKRGDAPYVSGRTNTWVKSKCRAGHEVVIGGYSTTMGKFRSLLVGVHRGDGFVYVGRVGTGFGATKVGELLRKLQALKAPKSPFTGLNAPKKESGVIWLRPELVAEIEFAGWTADGLVWQE